MPGSVRRRFAPLLAALVLLGPTAGVASDPEPGTRISVSPDALPSPRPGESVANPPQRVARPDGARPRVPDGFRAVLFAEGLSHARWLAVTPNGDVLVAESRAGRITLLRDTDDDGRADLRRVFAEGFRRPHGMAFRHGRFWVADLDGVWRMPYQSGALTAGAERERVTPAGALGDPAGHWTRGLIFHPDGERFFVAIGSRGNIAREDPPRATIRVFERDGDGGRTFAAGLRNPVGMDFRPGTDHLYTVVNERDGMGDTLVPDYLTRVREGDFYGWPYAYIGSHPQPRYAGTAPDRVAASQVPDLLFRSHSAPLGLVFHDGPAFPEAWRGDAFVALHGSWNAGDPRGYMVVRVPFDADGPAGGYQVFASGFRLDGGDRARVWGRPVGLAVAPDGALLVADDVGQTVWRIVPAE